MVPIIKKHGIIVVIREVYYECSRRNIEKLGYASTLFMDLDISKLRKLGWEPTVGLIEAYRRLIRYFVDGEE